MKLWKGSLYLIKVSYGVNVKVKKFHHEDSNDNCHERSGNLFAYLGPYDLNKKADNTNYKSPYVDGSNVCAYGLHFLHGLDGLGSCRIC